MSVRDYQQGGSDLLLGLGSFVTSRAFAPSAFAPAEAAGGNA
jgi:hypothetical protein